jgi:hypothetical protein
MFDWWWRAEPETALAMGCDLEPPVNCPNFEDYGSLTYWGLTLVRRVIAFGIPAFLLVSGYFIAFAAGRDDPKVNLSVLKARLVTLIIPYLLWSIIIFLIRAVVYRQGFFSPQRYLLALLTGGATGAYYYVPMLVQMYLLAPILVPAAKKYWKSTLLLTAVVQLTIELVRYLALFGVGGEVVNTIIRLTPLWFFPRRFFWFALGTVFGFHISSFKPFFQKNIKWLVGGTIVFFLASLVEFELLLRASGQQWINFYSTITTTIFGGLFMLSFIAAKKVKLPLQHKISEIGTKSFAIYLIHEQVLEIVGRGIFFFVPVLLKHQIIYQPIMIFTSLAVPLLLISLVSRSPLKKYAKYVFG